MSLRLVLYVEKDYPGIELFRDMSENFDKCHIGGDEKYVEKEFGFVIDQKRNINLKGMMPWGIFFNGEWIEFAPVLYNEFGNLEMRDDVYNEIREKQYIEFLNFWINKIPDDYWVVGLECG